MKSLIFLLFIAFASSINIPIIPKLIDNNSCIGGQIEKGVCKCPDKTALIGKECKPCVNGSIMFNRCRCSVGRYLEGNECKLYKVCSSDYVRIYNNTCIKKCPDNQIRVGNTCKNCSSLSTKNEFYNTCMKRRRITWEPITRQWSRPVAKPVIYLYPKETMDISVQLKIKNSKFTTIYPKFNKKNTWNVKAKPNGDILIKDKTYPYLFWEADSYAPQETNEGFIVSEENAEKFLEEKLEILGLNEKEKTDFITYWLPVLLKNKLSLCSFQSKKFFDNFELNITPKPDSLIRVFLTIKKLDTPINIKEQKLVSNERKGFTVIEWGGSELSKDFI